MDRIVCMLLQQQKRTNLILIGGFIYLLYTNSKLNKRVEELELNRR